MRRPAHRPGGGAVCLTVIVVRLVWVYPATYLPRWLDPVLARRDPSPPPRRRRSSSAGAACGVRSRWPPHWPCRSSPRLGEPFPERGLVIFLAFARDPRDAHRPGADASDRSSGRWASWTTARWSTRSSTPEGRDRCRARPDRGAQRGGSRPPAAHRPAQGVATSTAASTPSTTIPATDVVDGEVELSPEEVEELEHDEIRRAVITRRAPRGPGPPRPRRDHRRRAALHRARPRPRRAASRGLTRRISSPGTFAPRPRPGSADGSPARAADRWRTARRRTAGCTRY